MSASCVAHAQIKSEIGQQNLEKIEATYGWIIDSPRANQNSFDNKKEMDFLEFMIWTTKRQK